MTIKELILLESFHNGKSLEVEKGRTGFQNNVTMLVALWLLGEREVLAQQLQRLASFSPIQQALQQLLAGHQTQGIDIFRQLGYW